MPYLSFIYPEALWLVLLLVPFWLLAFATPRRYTTPVRFWLSLGIRTLVVLLLVLSLAGTQLRYRVDNLTTVFLVDGSDSVSPSARASAEAFIRDALREMEEGDQAAIVVFGDNALVERAPSTIAALGQIYSVPTADRTDIQEAVQLGLALIPDDTQKRLVLLSDGGENTGEARTAAQLAASRSIPIDIIDLSSRDSGDEVRVTSLDAPGQVRDGQEIELVAVVESTTEQQGVLRIFADRVVLEERIVDLQPGTNEFRLRVPAEGQGFQRYRARIETLADGRVQNNEAAALVQVQGMPRVLLVEEQAGDARNLQDALRAANIEAEIARPEALPTSLTALSAFDAVVLVNVPVRSLPVKAIAELLAYVRDLGRGLMMVGGTESYGVGGYGGTPVEEMLPVYMDVRNQLDRPNIALVFVIDKSGSMDACHCAGPNRAMDQFAEGGVPKIDIAKEAVVLASDLLTPRDTLGVVTFDTRASWTLPATQGASSADVADAISDVRPEGNTNVRAGLQAAEDMLAGVDANIKHVILLTDGWGEGGSNLDIAARMQEQGMTLSVVAAGSGSATYLENLAQTGGGRFYPATDMAEVPEIFLQETIVAAGNYIVERPFFPAIADESPILSGLDGLPILYGYNGTTLKDTAQSILVADDQSPVLAQWQYGLGRTIAWTSDTKGQWGSDLVTW
ncbi:MAG: VWA domain-containing protein, partial [Chloroflexaceae bacterium]|nr:VWA domain-containing protein [Chloroflexaceae bacterium]